MPLRGLGALGALAFVALGALAFAAALIFAAFWAQHARAHDSWISRGAFRNGAGEWCCGQNDCAMMDEGSVGTTAAGYAVHGFGTVRQYDGKVVRWLLDETVPYSEALPSPDGAYWICKLPGGTRRCFFAPRPNT